MLRRIYNAYQGEIYGISFFTFFANNYLKKTALPLWDCLIQVETITASRLEISLDKHHVQYDKHSPVMKSKGINDASAYINLPWPVLANTLINWIEPYEQKYRTWVSEATTEIDTFKFIANHETTLYRCWVAEKNGRSGLPVLLKFIEQH